LTSPHANLFGSVTGPLYQACRSLAAESGCSVYGLLMTITALTVYRLTGKDNFAIFTMSHGRHDRTDKQTIGDMINMMPVFYHLPVRLSFSQLIQACNMNYLEAMRHNRLPFNELIKFYPWVSIRHGFNFNHAWCVMSALESENSYCRPPLLPTFLPEQNQAHQFYVDVQETTGLKVDLLVRYQTVKYTRQRVARYLAILIDTLERVIREPDAPAAILRTPGLAESSRRDRTESF
jgi:non-ribosomal peptide synthetase component F